MKYEIADIRHLPKDIGELCREEATERQVERYVSEEAKKRTLLGIYTAKQLLSRQLGKPPAALKLAYTAEGKPYLPQSSVQVSISHSGQKVLCAVHDGPVGADIEEIKPFDLRLVRKICTEEERAYIGENSIRFFSVWTAKEAYLKLTGLGLRGGMKTVETASQTLYTHVRGYRLRNFLYPGYVCAIVYEHRD